MSPGISFHFTSCMDCSYFCLESQLCPWHLTAVTLKAGIFLQMNKGRSRKPELWPGGTWSGTWEEKAEGHSLNLIILFPRGQIMKPWKISSDFILENKVGRLDEWKTNPEDAPHEKHFSQDELSHSVRDWIEAISETYEYGFTMDHNCQGLTLTKNWKLIDSGRVLTPLPGIEASLKLALPQHFHKGKQGNF